MVKPQWFRNHRIIALFLLASLTAVFISACNLRSSEVATQSNNSPPTECRTVEHAMGETCIPINPQRLVTLSDFTLHHALVLGVKPIGHAFDGWRDKVPPYLTGRRNEIEALEEIGTEAQPDLEKILDLKPDLIIGSAWVREAYPLLSQIAPTVLDGVESAHNSGWREHFDFVAEALDKKAALQELRW